MVCASCWCAGCQKTPAQPADPRSTTEAAASTAATTTAPLLSTSDEESTAAKSDETKPDQATANNKIVAYYFHRTARCPTCLSIEQQTQKALEAGFIDEIDNGRIEWRSVNIEEAGNEHFEKDFALAGSALILAETAGDAAPRWKNLERVWELVEDPSAFEIYVWSELTEFMAE